MAAGRPPGKAAETRDKVLAAALEEAVTSGFASLRRRAVAARAEVSQGSVNGAFGTMDGLRDAVMTEAVRVESLAVIAQGLALDHPIAKGAPDDLKRAATATLAA